IARPQSTEAVLRHRCRQVVADGGREGQELVGHHGAHRVDPDIGGVGVAAAVPLPARHWIDRAVVQLAAEHVLGHQWYSSPERYFSPESTATVATVPPGPISAAICVAAATLSPVDQPEKTPSSAVSRRAMSPAAAWGIVRTSS